jgi:hypothetical protein
MPNLTSNRIPEDSMKKPRRTSSTALQPFEPVAQEIYSIESVVQITQMPRHQIAVYCLHGLISPVTAPELDGWWFDQEAIRALRRIESLRAEYEMNLAGLRVVSALFREVERLQEEVRVLHRF